MPKLSIVVLSYNTRDITLESLTSLIKSFQNNAFKTEIIIIDNASTDGSPEMLKSLSQKVKNSSTNFVTIFNKKNAGYPKGNNQGISACHGEYILFLNSDVRIKQVNWNEIITYLDNNNNVGALTVRVELPTGSLDWASHRGFPTIWNAFSYYTGLEKITAPFPFLNRIFGGYHLTHLDLNKIHTIDSPSGAFFLTRRHIVDRIGGFDEVFFMYGEDLDLAFRMREAGYSIQYDPHHTVTHLKYQSGIKQNMSKTQKQTKAYFYSSMRIFYKKHYEKLHPQFINNLVYFFINQKEKLSK